MAGNSAFVKGSTTFHIEKTQHVKKTHSMLGPVCRESGLSPSCISVAGGRDTDVSTKECVIVYSCILPNGRPVNMLIGHIEVEHAHAQAMFEAQKTVALGADGTAVNLGSKRGVITLLQRDAGDFVVPFHCMPCR